MGWVPERLSCRRDVGTPRSRGTGRGTGNDGLRNRGELKTNTASTLYRISEILDSKHLAVKRGNGE